MADDLGFTNDFLAEVKALNQPGTPESRQAAEQEIASLDFYRVAANSGREQDPAFTGKIEGLLRTNNTEGLRAYLGEQRANQVQELYNQAWRKFEQDRNVPRSQGEVVKDTAVGIPSTIVQGLLGAEAAIMGSPVGQFLLDVGGIGTNGSYGINMSGQYGPIAAQQNKQLQEQVIDPLYSTRLKNQRNLVGLQDAADQRDNRLQAEATAEAARGEFLPTLGAWSNRIAQDAISGATNTLSNPTVAAQGTTDAIGSMILAGGITKGLGAVGERVVAARTATLIEQQLAKGATRTAAEEFALKGVEALQKRLSNAAAMGGVGITEGAGAYNQQAQEVMSMSLDDLTKTSAPFREERDALLAEGIPFEDAEVLAQRIIANRSAQSAAGKTGLVSAGIGHFLPEGAQSPFRPVRGLAADAAREGVEEFLQGGTGQLIGNAATQEFVNPNQDVLEGVGTQAGAGGVLGIASAGLTKAPATAVQTAGVGAARVQSKVQERSQKVKDQVEAQVPSSLPGIVARSQDLSQNRSNLEPLVKVANEAMGDDEAANVRLQNDLNGVTKAGVVYSLPGSISALSTEDQAKFTTKQTRATAVNNAAQLLLNEKDPKKAAAYAQVFSDLMDPVRQYSQTTGELGRLTTSQEASQALAKYQGILSDIQALPNVQKASQKVLEVLAKEKTPQALSAMAVVDPAMGGEVKAADVQNVLTHATPGQLTEAQQTALRGSLALLQAREAVEAGRDADEAQALIQKHLVGDRNAPTTGRQTTTELNPVNINDGKYSARGHVDRIIKSMMSGDVEQAKAYMKEFGNFTQHFQNKVGALNESFQRDGENISYQQYVGNGQFKDSESNPGNFKHKTMFVNPKSQNSIKQARIISQEAGLLGQLYEGLRQAYPQLNEQAIQTQSLNLTKQERAPAEQSQGERTPTRFSEQVRGMDLRTRARMVGIDNVTGLRTRQAWEESPRTGEKVMILTSTAVKPINDDPFGGHDVTNDLLRVMGAAIGKIDPNAARGGTNFILETNRSAESVLNEVRAAMPDAAIELAYGEGNTLEDAFQDESKRTTQARAEGRLPERGQTAFDLTKLQTMQFAKGKAQEKLSQQTVDRVRKLTDQQFEEQVLMDPVTPGVLSGAGWRAIPKKAFVASLDLKGLKKLNDLISKEFGNEYLRMFSEAGLKMGGQAFDFAHLSGDEYAVQSNDKAALEKWLNDLDTYLQENVQLVAEHNGEIMEVVPAFRKGVGTSYGDADKNLNTAKRAELAAVAAAQAQAEADSRAVRGAGGEGARGDQAARPESGREVVPAQEVTPAPAPVVEQAPKAPLTTAEKFPNLFSIPGKVRNFFAEGLELRPDSIRTMDTDHPISAVTNAINAENGIRQFIGGDLRGNATPEVLEAYRGLMATSTRNVAAALNQSLQAFLNKPHSKDDPRTMGELFKSGEIEFTMMPNGKVLNMVEVKPNGSLGYNSALLEGAIMAGLQWQLSSNQRNPESRPDEIAQELGFQTAEDVPSEIIDMMKMGQSTAQAKQSLANYVKRFWGVRPNNNAPMGVAEALPEAMASELLLAMEKAGLLTINRIDLKKYPQLDSNKDYNRFVPVDSVSALNNYPELLEEMVVRQADFAAYYGDAVPPVADRQLSNSHVSLSDETKQALTNMQAQDFYLNMPMVDGMLSMTEDGIINLFGNVIPKDAKSTYNKNHLESLESQNNSLRGAFKELQRLRGEMGNIAGQGDVGQLAKRYKYAVNSVNRIMMLGAYNPQSSKLMREMIMPTWSTLDMSDENGEHYRYFMQAFAQAMGQKVHQKAFEENVKWSKEAIEGKLAPAIGILSSWLQSKTAFPSTDLKKSMEEAGVEVSPLTIMALTEAARLQTADKKAFRTPMYLESDGMTNGPFNSMGLLAIGEVTAGDIQNWKRGGLALSSEAKTADQLRKSVGNTDLYKEGMNAAQVDVNDQLRSISKQKNGMPILGVAKAMFTVMQTLLDGEVSWDADKNEWQFERGLGKNPSTVLVYGAGNAGIANKLVSRLTTAFYEKVSAMAKTNGTWQEAALEMFPNEKPADAVYKAEQLRKSMDVLAAFKVAKGKDGFFIAEKAAGVSSKVDKSPQQFEFSKEELKRMQDTMKTLMVDPMKEGIRRVLGPSVFESGDLLVKATQFQSTVAREIYIRAINEKLNEKIAKKTKQYKGDEKRAKSEVSSEFLSRNELNKIWDSLKDVMPLVSADGQNFLIAKNSLLSATGKGTSMYSRALNDSIRTEPYAEGIASAGVAARPYMTIGMGDARMVRKAYETGMPGSMQVFDGINLPVNRIAEFGSQVNQAALTAWQGNIFSSVRDTFKKLTENPKFKELRNNIEQDTPFSQALIDAKVNIKDTEDILSELEGYAVRQDARNRVLAKVDMSMDQMAGTYKPFVRTGGLDLSLATDQEAAAAINEELWKEMKKPAVVTGPKMENTLHKTGVTVYNKTNMGPYLKWLSTKVTPEESSLLREIFKSGNLKDIRIVMGTPSQVESYQQAEALSSSLAPLRGQGKDINGYYHPAENTIYLMNHSVETAVHELIHAGTLKQVQSFYEGKQVKSAQNIRELEKLMNLFLKEELQYEGDAQTALYNARSAIMQHEGTTAENKANMLNEFMAWTLANRALVAEQSKTDNPLSKIAAILKRAFDALITMMTGKAPSSKATDFASQVRFNTAQVAAEASVETMVKNVSLAHATLAGVESNRLMELSEVFGQKIARYLTSNPDTMAETLEDPLKLSKETATKAREVFDLNAQASDTFQMMVMAMATEAKLNPQVMMEAQSIYEHLLDGLKQSDFLTGKLDAQNDAAQALEKYNFISGHTQSAKNDPTGRSTLLPSFLALAAVDDNFRAVLAKKDMPEKIGKQVVGLDSALEVAGQKVMDVLSDRLTGQNNPQNVRVAIDQLTQELIKTSQQSLLTMADKMSPTSFLNSLNEKSSFLLESAGKAAGRAGKKLGQQNNVISRGAATVLKTVSILASSEDAAVVGEEVLRQMDKHPSVGGFFKDVVADMIGRTSSQADVYDMLKKVRALVSQTRQAYRENLPQTILKQFKNEPTADQWNLLWNVAGRYDLASLLEGRTASDVLSLASDPQALSGEVSRLEVAIGQSPYGKRYMEKIDQYVNYVKTGKRGVNLLRNAYAISELLGEDRGESFTEPTDAMVQDIDQLITMKLLNDLSDAQKEQITKLVTEEYKGMEFTLNYLKGQRRTEMAKASQGMAKFNHYKGLLPSEFKGRGHVVVEADAKATKMLEMGYERMGPYVGSSIEGGKSTKSYWYSPEGGVKTTYNQGIAQNVQGTAFGVRTETGSSIDGTAGIIRDPAYVETLAKRLHKEKSGNENLSPLYDEAGTLVGFERSLDPEKMKVLQGEQHLAKMIGEWQGRQVEESWANMVNQELINNLHDMYENDPNKDRYVNLFDKDLSDPVLRDAISIMPWELKRQAEAKFGRETFMVRRNMLNTVVGYRNASVGDLWTGTSRWSPKMQEQLKSAFMAMPGLGKDAYRRLVWAERNWQAAMAAVRTNIVVRSMIVPAANFMSGIAQLNVRGVSLVKALKSVPEKVREVEYYSKTMAKKIELEAEKFANEGNITMERKLDAQLTALNDSLKRLSIWPLIEAGEFSSIADVGQTAESLGAEGGTLVDKMVESVDKLPPILRDLARQGYMARDTAMFQAMQKATQYSDFVMKAIYFDHLQKYGMSPKAALANITEEFNNYDVPPGRDRGYAESVGLAWFLNYKIRATKIGLSMIRKNPLNMLMYMSVPHPSSVGIPGTDNLISSLMELSLGRSFGPGMATSPIALNPWYSLTAN